MKKLYILMLAIFLAPILAFGADFRSGDQVSIPSGETINDDIYAGAGTVTVGGIVAGDFIGGGGTVLINSEIRGDVIVGGGTVNILGSVGDDVRVGGGNILIQSSVAGDVLAGGGTINILGSGIKGDLVAGGGLIHIESPVAGDIKIGGGEIFINAPVGGNASINADKITLGPKAVISGNLTYKSPNEAKFESGAAVRGKIDFQKKEVREKNFGGGFFKMAVLIKALMLLLGALLVSLVFPRYAKEIVSRAFARPMYNLGMGLVFMIVTPILAIILLVTVIGIPLGIITLLGYIITMIWSAFIVPILLGSLVYGWIKKDQKGRHDWKVIILGVVLFTILGFIPIVGWIIIFGFMLLALGAMIKFKFALARDWR